MQLLLGRLAAPQNHRRRCRRAGQQHWTVLAGLGGRPSLADGGQGAVVAGQRELWGGMPLLRAARHHRAVVVRNV